MVQGRRREGEGEREGGGREEETDRVRDEEEKERQRQSVCVRERHSQRELEDRALPVLLSTIELASQPRTDQSFLRGALLGTSYVS